MAGRVTVDLSGGVADVRLDRPDKRNALDFEMFEAIAEVGSSLAATEDLRAVVLSGEGPSFCAGLDLALFGQLDRVGERGHPGRIEPGAITHLGQQVAWVWQQLEVPVIAAVHGHAIGGGLQIALGADIRLVHPDTQLSVREVHWGLVPDMTGTLVLSRLTRPDVAKELTFTARTFDGREAAAIGLATRLSDDPHRDAIALAAEIAANSPAAVRAAKRLFNRILHDGAADQFAAERDEVSALVAALSARR